MRTAIPLDDFPILELLNLGVAVKMFIRLAYAAKADAIVTGDEDLLSLAPDSSIPILTPVAFRVLP